MTGVWLKRTAQRAAKIPKDLAVPGRHEVVTDEGAQLGRSARPWAANHALASVGVGLGVRLRGGQRWADPFRYTALL